MQTRIIFLAIMLTAALLIGCEVAPDDASEDGNAVAQTGPACSIESMAQLPDVRITSVVEEATPVAHCKVAGVIGTETNFELLLPEVWNGKFVMGGGGGFVGSVINTALGYGVLQKGYATVGTDTGHQGHPLDASWALNNLERIVSFGHQAVHRTTVTAKALITDYYGQDISRNLFFGCSRGGGQALMEAQRYPDDYDGIVAGAPAYSWSVELAGRNLQLNQAMYPDPNNLDFATFTPEAQQFMGEAVLRRCDLLDGIEDGILNNPLECKIDVDEFACADGQTDACLTPAQVKAAKRVYEGLVIDDEQIWPGYAPGAKIGENGWSRWISGGLAAAAEGEFQDGIPIDPDLAAPVAPSAHFAFGNGVMKYFVFQDPDWDYSTYDFSTFWSDVAAVAPTLDATDPNIDAFRERGGKLLMFNGWRDMALTPLGTIKYYDEVLERDASATDDVQLIMLPGMDHCFGGPGPSFVNWVDEIDRWVETDEAPEQVTAYWINEQMQPDGSRPACAYPNILKYDGEGDTRDASSFSCVNDN
jgi:pimeloyl-ACP methyl ester carboxylesterase